MSVLCLFLWAVLSSIAYFNRDKAEAGQMKDFRSLPGSSACSSLFILYEERSRDFIRLLLYVMLAAANIVCLNSLLGSANHLIISLDIVVFFSILIVVRYHNLKVAFNLLQY